MGMADEALRWSYEALRSCYGGFIPKSWESRLGNELGLRTIQDRRLRVQG